MKGKKNTRLDLLYAVAVEMGLAVCFSKRGDLIVKEPKSIEHTMIDTSFFDEEERSVPTADELLKIVNQYTHG